MAPNMPGWAHPYQNPFVLYADGGDDPAPEPDTDPGPGGDPDPGPEPDDAWQPPTREEWEQQQASLKRASAEAANRRKYLRQHGIDPKTGNKLEPDPEPEPVTPPKPQDPNAAPPPGMSEAEVRKQVERAVAEARIEGMRGAKKMVAGFNKALSDAGWNGTRLELIMPLVDFDEIDPEDDEDLRERIENVKKIFPEGFKRTRNPAGMAKPNGGSGQNGTPAGNVDTADKKPPAPQPKGWAEQVAEKLLRG